MESISAKELDGKSVSKPEVKQQLTVQKIFNKGLLFEAASLTPDALKISSDATLELQASVNTNDREDGATEVVLALNLTAKATGNLLWRVQLQQAGWYTLTGFSEEQKKQTLNGYCANQLYHYACVTINNTVTQGGFSPIFLAPMNFEALYQQQLKQEKSKLADRGETEIAQHKFF